MKTLLFALVTMFTVSLVSASEVVIEVQAIAGKSKQEVTSVLGNPSSCTGSKLGEKCRYDKGESEIIFINGKSDWITIEGLNSIPYSADALMALGLKASKPSFKNEFTIRWVHIQGLLEVSVFPSGTNVDYAYIKVRTK